LTTKVGIIGTGFAARAHADALRRLPGVQLAAVASRDRERAEGFAREHGIARACGGYAELLSDEDIAAVHVCAANDVHVELSTAALRAGKHVLCEKPLGSDARETAQLAALAEEAARGGVVSGVCFNYRFFPLVREIRERLAAGDAGPVHLVHGAYLQDWLLDESDWNWRVDERVGGPLRAVADIGSHWCDLAQFLTRDRIEGVLADLGVLHRSRRLPADGLATFARPERAGDGDGAAPVTSDDFAGLLLRFASGARGVVVLSQVSAGRKNGLVIEVDARSASFAWNQEDPDRAWIGTRDRHNLEIVRDPATLSPQAAGLAHYPPGHAEGWPDALRNLVADFHGSVAAAGRGEAHASSCASFAEAHRLVELVEAVGESHRLGRWVEVGAHESVAA
jgi:predicted dehydrogenase